MKLVENLRAIDTGNRKHIMEPLHMIKYLSNVDRDYVQQFAKEYSIIVTIGANQWIEEDLVKASDGQVIQEAVNSMKHAILEHIYGEIYRDLRDLQFLMHNELSYHESPSTKKLKEIVEKITL